MINDWEKLSRIFDRVLTLPPEGRTACIHELCEGNPGLEKKVQELLSGLESTTELLELYTEKNQALLEELQLLQDEPFGEDAFLGETLGRWKLIRLLGRGGMGTVYEAERIDSEGIRQKGALKIIHKSLFTPLNLERFRLEQQILARLQHPNIAAFIDSGIHQNIPYMVMEFVEGESILTYCDNRQLSLEERLLLFKTVCNAIHYAHKNLIVHRDLKPENILITSDGFVKILDFGIAKLLDPDLHSIYKVETQAGMRLMSLEYASPEQIAGGDVATSTDLYSLGVLYYKLLTGLHPYDLQGKRFYEVEKIILEAEPSLPSRRYLAREEAERLRLASLRGVKPAELIQIVRGDLDAIAHKALHKDPDQRYVSAEAFIADLERYSKGLPVQAQADTLSYRARKFIHRHRWGVAVAVFIVLSLAGGLASILWHAQQAQLHAQQAEVQAEQAEQVTSLLVDLFQGSDPTKANDGSMTAREMLDQGFDKVRAEMGVQPVVQAKILGIIGKVYQNLGIYDQALPALEEAVNRYRNIGDTSSQYVFALLELANLEYRRGQLKQAENFAREALEINLLLYDENHPEVASVLNTLAIILEEQGMDEDARNMLRRVVEIRRQQPEADTNLAANLNNLATMLLRSDSYGEAEEMYREAIELIRNSWGEEHPYMAYTLNGYSRLHQQRGDYELAEADMRRALEIGRSVFPEQHPFLAVVQHNLGKLFEVMQRYEDAATHFQLGLQSRRNSLPPDHPDIAASLDALGSVMIQGDHPADAESMLREALEIRRHAYGDDDPRTAQSKARLGQALLRLQRHVEAEPLLMESQSVLLAAHGEDHVLVRRISEDLATLRTLATPAE